MDVIHTEDNSWREVAFKGAHWAYTGLEFKCDFIVMEGRFDIDKEWSIPENTICKDKISENVQGFNKAKSLGNSTFWIGIL